MTVVSEQEQGAELPERWSAKAKIDVVLRLLRVEAVDAMSREIQVPAHELDAWRYPVFEGGIVGHTTQQDCSSEGLVLSHLRSAS